jgi:hypothetical protein
MTVDLGLNEFLTAGRRCVSLNVGKMNIRSSNQLVLAVILLAASLAGLWAQDTAPRRATPIIFSAPKSDSVSSNLNQLGTKSYPLTDLESGLTKPFEIFEGGRSSDSFRAPTMKFAPPAPVLNSKKLKDLMEKHAEQSYLLSEDKEGGLMGEDLLKSDDPFSPTGKKLETRLDRYYDRIDRTRSAATNQTRGSDLFGNKHDENEKDQKDDLNGKSSSGLFDGELSASARSLKQMSNSSPEGGRLTSEKLKPRNLGDIFGLNPVEASQSEKHTLEKESRLDEFKRLMDGSGYVPRNDFNAATPPSVSAPFQSSKPVTSLSTPPLAPTQPAPRDTFANTAGLIGAPGKPSNLPDYAMGTPSLTPAPLVQQPQPQPPKPEFKIPKRRF